MLVCFQTSRYQNPNKDFDIISFLFEKRKFDFPDGKSNSVAFGHASANFGDNVVYNTTIMVIL